ncbi:MAG: peptide-methionine (S)-S-oxide reductase, partial [Candidatus Neomarinimicrobiota bacterium]
MKLKKVLILVTILLILTGLKLQGEETKITMNAKKNEIATLGGGCFWCIEAVYDKIEGVENVVSGYSGGNKPDPTYSEVCSGKT